MRYYINDKEVKFTEYLYILVRLKDMKRVQKDGKVTTSGMHKGNQVQLLLVI